MGEDGRGWERKARLALRLGRKALGTAIRERGGRRKEGERKKGWMKAVISAFSMRSEWHSRGCALRLGRN